MIIVEECKYCDSTSKGQPYGKDEPECCLTCGAEWLPIKVEYPDEDQLEPYFDLEEDTK